MKARKNPEGILVKAELVATELGNIPEYVDDVGGIIPMKVRGAKKSKIHILNNTTPAEMPDGSFFQGYALCGAGYPSMQYPHGSGEIIQPRDIIKAGARQGSVKVTCYRCIKINAQNVGPTIARDFIATAAGRNRSPHDMLPGGREGFYALELDQTLAMDPEVLDAQVELATTDPEYWENQKDLFRVGSPFARTQPSTADLAEGLVPEDDPMGSYPPTSIAPRSIPRNNNPAFKVGDRVSEKGRLGKITAMHTKGTADVLFDDMTFAIRRQIPTLMKVKANGIQAEVQRMINSAPPKWKAMFKVKVGKVKPTVDEAIHAILNLTPSGAEYGPTGSKRWAVPAAVKADAIKGLRLSFRENYTSASGIGLARAMQLATWPKVWDRSIDRMYGYFDRHISDTESATFGNDSNPSNGWMAWLNWGGTPGYEWAAAIKGSTRKIMSGERGYDRRKRVTKQSKKVPAMANPRNKQHGVLFEVYDAKMAQRNAVVQGIYETLVRQYLGLKWNKPFKDKRGVRLDQSSMMSKPTIVRLTRRAFAIATATSQKHGYTKKGTQDPTAKGIARAKERAKDKKHLEENILDYETTLAMSRKEPYRIVQRTVNRKKRYYVMPLGTFSYTMKAAVDKLRAQEKKDGIARIPPKNKRKNPVIPSAMEAFGSGADKFTKKVVMTSPRPAVVTWKDGTEVQIGTYIGFTIQGPQGAFRAQGSGRETAELLRGLKEEVGSAASFAMKDVLVSETFATEPEEAHIRSVYQAPDRSKRGGLQRGDNPIYAAILKSWRYLNLKDRYGDTREPAPNRVSLLDLLEHVDQIRNRYVTKTGLSRPNEITVFDAIAELKDRGIIKDKGLRKDARGMLDELTAPIQDTSDMYMFNELIAKGLARFDDGRDVVFIEDRNLEYVLPSRFRKKVVKKLPSGEEITELTYELADEKVFRKPIQGAMYTPVSYVQTYGSVTYNQVLGAAIKRKAKKAGKSAKEYLNDLVLGQVAQLSPADLIVFTVDEWMKTRVYLEKAAYRGNFFSVPALSKGKYFNSVVDAASRQVAYQVKVIAKQIKKRIPYEVVPVPTVTKKAEKEAQKQQLVRPPDIPDSLIGGGAAKKGQDYAGPVELVFLQSQPYMKKPLQELGAQIGAEVSMMGIPNRPVPKGATPESVITPDPEVETWSVAPNYDSSLLEMEKNAVLLLAETKKSDPRERTSLMIIQIHETGESPIVPYSTLNKKIRAQKWPTLTYTISVPSSRDLTFMEKAVDQVRLKVKGKQPAVVAFIGPKTIRDNKMIKAFINNLLTLRTNLPAVMDM